MRVFFALEFPPEFIRALAEWQGRIAPFLTGGTFTRPDNFHLTLRFIGEWPEPDLPLLHSSLEQATATASRFEIGLSHVGFFEKRRLRKIVWCAPGQGIIEIEDLARALQHALYEKLSLPNEEFAPHITVARQVRCTPEQWNQICQSSLPATTATIGFASLMESVNLSGVLTYRPLFRVPFAS